VRHTDSLAEVSFSGLRVLYHCWKLRDQLSCEGTTWSFRKRPSFAVGRPVIDELANGGLVRRVNRYDDAAHDSFRITNKGMTVIRDREPEYQSLLEEKFDESIRWTEPIVPGVVETSLVTADPERVELPNGNGLWLRKRVIYVPKEDVPE